jgi:hypothetical protein
MEPPRLSSKAIRLLDDGARLAALAVLLASVVATATALGSISEATTPDSQEGYPGFLILPRIARLVILIGMCVVADTWLLLGIWQRWPWPGLAPGLIIGVIATLGVLA